MNSTTSADDDGSERSFSFSSLNILPKHPPRKSLAKTVIPTVQEEGSLPLKKKASASRLFSRSKPRPPPPNPIVRETTRLHAPAKAPTSTPIPSIVTPDTAADPPPPISSGATRLPDSSPAGNLSITRTLSSSSSSVSSMDDRGHGDDNDGDSHDLDFTEPTTMDEDSDEAGYDLKAPPPAVSPGDIERLSKRFFSFEHLDVILGDPDLKRRLSKFLIRYRPHLAATLERFLEIRKAKVAIKYANSVAEKMTSPYGPPKEKAFMAANLNEDFCAISHATTDELVDEALPAYLTHRLVTLVTDCLMKEITGNVVPLMQDLIPSLAEVYCVTDPSIKDNPIVYASEEFYSTTQYSSTYTIGRNCRFLQGPGTQPTVVKRLVEALAAGNEICETILNYRRDGSPFLNLLMMAPLYDNKGEVKYYLGAQIDVSSLVEEGKGLDSFARLLQTEDEEDERANDRQDGIRNVLAQLGDMMTDEEVTSINAGRRRAESDASRTNSRVSAQKPPPPAFRQRKILGMDDDDARELWPHPRLGKSGRMPGVYQNYLLVRPYPSLRITFTSPALRIPGLLQARFIDRIGGAAHVRDGILDAFESGTSVTAKITWIVRDRASDEEEPAVGKARWIHCTPLLGSDKKVGVWMIVMVEGEPSTVKMVDRGGDIGHLRADKARDGSVHGGSEGSLTGRNNERTSAAVARGSSRASNRQGSSEAGPGSISRMRNDKMASSSRNHLYAEYLRGQKNGAIMSPRTSESELEKREVNDQFLDF